MTVGGAEHGAASVEDAVPERPLLPKATRIRIDAVARMPQHPVHPGEYLESRFLKPRGITQGGLALAMGVSRRRVNELIRGHRRITPDTAVRLAAYFETDAAFWLQLQADWDAYQALEKARIAGGGGR